MRVIDSSVLEQFEGQELRLFWWLDVHLQGLVHRFTNCDIPLPVNCPEAVFKNIQLNGAALDLKNAKLLSYGGEVQDVDGRGSIEDGGNIVRLMGNTWKAVEHAVTVDADTVLSFDFMSKVQGEVQGIGFDSQVSSLNPSMLFQLWGTQPWGLSPYVVNGGLETGDFTGWATYGSGGNMNVSNATKVAGTYSFYVQMLGDATYCGKTQTNMIKVEPGGTYKLSGYIYIHSWVAGYARIRVRASEWNPVNITTSGNKSWTYFEDTVQIPDGVTEINLDAYVTGYGGPNPDMVAYFDEIKFERVIDGSWQHFDIKVGAFYTGAMEYLAFVLDADAVDSNYALYQPRRMRIQSIGYGTQRIVDSVSLEIDNLNSELTPYFIGGNPQGSPATIGVVVLDENYQPVPNKRDGFQDIFDGVIDDWDMSARGVTLKIVPDYARWAEKTIARHPGSCRWKKFKGRRCVYSGAATWCDRSYARCAELGNTDNFGGFRWLAWIIGKEIWWGKKPAEPKPQLSTPG